MDLPKRSEVVVVGAGVLGASTAFHLRRLGREVVLVDRGPLAAETSSQGAGFLCSLRPSIESSRIVSRSTRFYRQFEEETGYKIDLHMVGGLRTAFSAGWLETLQSEATAARATGVEVHVLGAAEVQRLAPGLNLAGSVGGTFTPEEGYVTSTREIGIGLARGAARQGATVLTGVTVRSLRPSDPGKHILETDLGTIVAGKVVIAANAGAWPLGRALGMQYPSYPLLHECAVYDLPVPISASMPTVRLAEHDLYIRHEAAGIMIGGVGSNPHGPGTDSTESQYMLQNVAPDYVELADARRRAHPFVPGLAQSICFRIQRGLAMVAPDLEPIAGEWMPGVFVVSADLRGVQSAPMLGLMIAQLVTSGRSEFDHAAYDPHRFAHLAEPASIYSAAQSGLRPRTFE